MLDTEQIFINLSKRSITFIDIDGQDKEIMWEWNKEGAEGFSESISDIVDTVDSDFITYCFAETE